MISFQVFQQTEKVKASLHHVLISEVWETCTHFYVQQAPMDAIQVYCQSAFWGNCTLPVIVVGPVIEMQFGHCCSFTLQNYSPSLSAIFPSFHNFYALY